MKKNESSLAGQDKTNGQEKIRQNNIVFSDLKGYRHDSKHTSVQIAMEEFYYSDPGMIRACEPCFYYGVCDHHPHYNLPFCMDDEKRKWEKIEGELWQ